MCAIHELAKILGRQKYKALLFSLALTGSDTTSFVKGIGKKKAWEARDIMPEITPIFAQLGSNGINSTISAMDFKYLQCFVCVMCRKKSPRVKVNEAGHAISLKE